MDEEAVDRLERDLRQVLVRAVDRVPRLKADDPPPAALGERSPRVARVERELGELRLRAIEDDDSTGEVVRLLAVETCHAGVGLVRRAEDLLRLRLSGTWVHMGHFQHTELPTALVARATRSPLGASSTARQTGIAHGRPFISRMSSTTDS